MIYNVLIYEDGTLIDVYRIGAWHEEHAEDLIASRVVKLYVDSEYIRFRIISEGKPFAVIPEYRLVEARDEFFRAIGLDTAASI